MAKNNNFIVIIVLAINILIVWLPNQFQTAGIQEEWRWRATFDGGITTYNDIGSDSSEEQFYTRPFLGILNGLSYFLSQESFLGLHILTIILLLFKAYGLYLLTYVLFSKASLWGYLCALILVFYPSDPGIVSFRPIMHHLAVLSIIWSIYFLIKYYKTNKKLYVGLIWLSQLVATMSVESGYPFFFFAPLIILILEQRITKKWITIVILYYIVPAITFLYSFVLIMIVSVSWQRTAIASYTLREYLRNIYSLYQYNLVTAWQDIITYFFSKATPSDIFVFIASGLVSFLGSIWLIRQDNQQSIKPLPLRTFGLAIFGAGFAILLGYAMFLPSRTHVLTHFRVYLLSSVGLAIVFGTVSYALYSLLSQYIVKYLILIGFSILVGLSGVFANKTHHEYLEISNQQGSLVRQIVEAVPALDSKAIIVIKTQSNSIFKRLSIGGIYKPIIFTPMLQYIYNDYENIQGGVICFTNYLSCEFTPDGMDIVASNFLNINLPVSYEELILFNITKQGKLTLIEEDDTLPNYDPMRLINQDAASPPRRIQTIYGDTD